MSGLAYVYVIFRPDGRPCYVGKGTGNRWNNHRTRSTNPHLARIVAKSGDLPKVKIRQGLTDEEALSIEVTLIAAIGREAHGGPLVNLTDGGDGLLNPSLATRAKMSAKAKARATSPEGRAEMARRGGHNSAPKRPEVRAKMSASHKGKKKTAEHQAAITAALTGKPKSAAHIAALAAAQKGRVVGPHSPAKRAAISDGNKRYWDRWRAGGILRRMRNGKERAAQIGI